MPHVAVAVALAFAFASPDHVDARVIDAGLVDANANDPAVHALERATDALDKTLALKSGPADVDVVVATLHVGDGVVFTGAAGAKTWETATNNASSGKEVALVGLPSGARVLIEWADVGRVNDDDAAELTPQNDVLLTRVKAAAKAPLVVDRWLRAPAYDAQAHDLSWCVSTNAGFDCAHRVLGRRGFLAISLLGDAKVARENAETELASLLTSLAWKAGEDYGATRKDGDGDGDGDAGYGLSALVSSGAPVPVGHAKLVVGPRARVLAAAAMGAIVAALLGARSARRRMRGGGASP